LDILYNDIMKKTSFPRRRESIVQNLLRLCRSGIFILCLCAHSAQAYVDAGLYPFADVCGPDIEEYCDEVGALGDCMVDNYSMLEPECGDAVFYWAGDHWGWHDPEVRDRWAGMSGRERHDYAISHQKEFDKAKANRAAKPNVSRDMEFKQFGAGSFHHVGGFHGGGGMRR
jgi:hypothetical protein